MLRSPMARAHHDRDIHTLNRNQMCSHHLRLALGMGSGSHNGNSIHTHTHNLGIPVIRNTEAWERERLAQRSLEEPQRPA